MTAALALMDARQRVDRVVQHVGGRHRGDHDGAVHHGVERRRPVAAGAGHPHPRDYGAFARRLAVYVRDRHVVSLEFAIRSMTSLPASVFGITDRGVIRPGAFADLVIFDPADDPRCRDLH